MNKWDKRINLLQREIELLSSLKEIEVEKERNESEIFNSELILKLRQHFDLKRNKKEKFTSLSDIIISIGRTSNVPLSLTDLIKVIRDNGYVSKSKNFSNLVYQSITKLVNTGIFTKTEDRLYQYVDASK